jgi:predicted glycoside hydrolase/deacetylase ChbG (UPF0249 family)
VSIAEQLSRGRNVVIHEDDVGMTHGANTAFRDLCAAGMCSSGSVMVPCPWFPEAAALAAADPALDLGIHLTLNSEKKPYRWRPLTSPPASAGLTDPQGYFWADVVSLRRHAAPEAVGAELRVQIDTALAAGIDATHLDAHMGGALAPEFVDIYLQLARDYRLPLLLTRTLEAYGPRHNLGGPPTERYDAAVAAARSEGFPVCEVALETPWHRGVDAATAYREMVTSIPEGLTFLSMHFNARGDFEVIEPEFAHVRAEEYELFHSPEFGAWFRSQDLRVLGFREIRDALRAEWGGNA